MDLSQKGRIAGRWGWILFTTLILAGTSVGQEGRSSAVPNIEILKLHWEKQVRLPRNFGPSVIPTGGTFNDPGSRVSTTSPGPATTGAPAARTAGSNSVTFPAVPGRLPVFYVYSLKIRNTGSKLIEGIAWDYLFIDANSKAELGKHQFLSYEKVPVNKSVTLPGQLRSPPVRVIRTADSPRSAPAKFIERAVIQCVLYADDTVWKNASARVDVCELLKHSTDLMKRKTP